MEKQKLTKTEWLSEYKLIAQKHGDDTGDFVPIEYWDCYEQYWKDGYTPEDGFNQDLETFLDYGI